MLCSRCDVGAVVMISPLESKVEAERSADVVAEEFANASAEATVDCRCERKEADDEEVDANQEVIVWMKRAGCRDCSPHNSGRIAVVSFLERER